MHPRFHANPNEFSCALCPSQDSSPAQSEGTWTGHERIVFVGFFLLARTSHWLQRVQAREGKAKVKEVARLKENRKPRRTEETLLITACFHTIIYYSFAFFLKSHQNESYTGQRCGLHRQRMPIENMLRAWWYPANGQD